MSKANKSNKAIKYRLYPNDEQKVMFAKTFGCCRFVYNQLLALQKQRYKDGESHLSKLKSNEFATRTLKKDYDFLKEIDKFAVSNAVFHLADAYDRFFKKQNHFPKFKSKRKSKKSYTTNFTNNNILIGKNVIKLPKVGMVKAVIHKLPKDDWKLKSVTVSQDSVGNYFSSDLRKTFHLFPNQVQMLLDLTINPMDFIWTVMGIKQEFINTIEKVIRSLLNNKEDFHEKQVLKRMKQNQATILNK